MSHEMTDEALAEMHEDRRAVAAMPGAQCDGAGAMSLAETREEFFRRFDAKLREIAPADEFFSGADLQAYANEVGPIWWQENGHDMTPEACAEADVREFYR